MLLFTFSLKTMIQLFSFTRQRRVAAGIDLVNTRGFVLPSIVIVCAARTRAVQVASLPQLHVVNTAYTIP